MKLMEKMAFVALWVTVIIIAVPHFPAGSTNLSHNHIKGIPSNKLAMIPESSSDVGTGAPMGMVVLGGASNSTSYLGIVNLSSLYVSNNTISSYQNTASFQLNAVIELSIGGEQYAYWVQDVAELNTQDRYVYFLDNVWNFSSSAYTLQSNSVTGNGSISDAGGAWSGDYIYAYEPSSYSFLPGNDVVLNYPAKIQLKVTSTVSDTGYPEVIFQYNDGFGWVTYDNVYFFTNDITQDSNFVANGLSTPGGSSYTAGIIMGGYGNGAGTNFQYGDLSLGLEYWNGYNYQAPLFAYNHGSDTAETVSDAFVSMSSNNGIPVAQFTSGSADPGFLYNFTQVSNLIVNTYSEGGVISITSSNYGNFNATYKGSLLEETLLPGEYDITTEYTILQASADVDLTNGGLISLSYQAISALGLPNGENWGVTLFSKNNAPSNATYYFNSNITALFIQNGADNFRIHSPIFLQPETKDGAFQHNGNTWYIQFHKVGYFKGSIYPNEASLYVNGTLETSNNGLFNVSLSPGVYNITAISQGYVTHNEKINVYYHSVDYQNITLVKIPSNNSIGGINISSWIPTIIGLGMFVVVASAVYVIRLRKK